MPDIRNLKVGQTLYTLTRRLMGNTTIRETAVHTVTVKEIDPEHKWVVASWNYNPPNRYYRRHVARWRVNDPRRHNAEVSDRRAHAPENTTGANGGSLH